MREQPVFKRAGMLNSFWSATRSPMNVNCSTSSTAFAKGALQVRQGRRTVGANDRPMGPPPRCKPTIPKTAKGRRDSHLRRCVDYREPVSIPNCAAYQVTVFHRTHLFVELSGGLPCSQFVYDTGGLRFSPTIHTMRLHCQEPRSRAEVMAPRSQSPFR